MAGSLGRVLVGGKDCGAVSPSAPGWSSPPTTWFAAAMGNRCYTSRLGARASV